MTSLSVYRATLVRFTLACYISCCRPSLSLILRVRLKVEVNFPPFTPEYTDVIANYVQNLVASGRVFGIVNFGGHSTRLTVPTQTAKDVVMKAFNSSEAIILRFPVKLPVSGL